ncbi:MAG TPA: site-2 protease family protein [Armatimonadetes bacterium]|nr:site-2 protease family protein [Armatimonadota bacterium]
MLVRLILIVVLFLPAIIVHEYAHAWTADKLGDPTPRWSGRLTLNPKAHFDLFGALTFLITFLLFHIAIGWAKPVPINPLNFPNPVRDMAIVAAAGPLSNLAQAAGCYVLLAVLNLLYLSSPALPLWDLLLPLSVTLLIGAIIVNLFLALINLIPVPPLDGSRILRAFVSYEVAAFLDSMERFGPIFALLAIWVIIRLAEPLIGGLFDLLFGGLEVVRFSLLGAL